MKFLVVSFLLVAVASARPNSMLRPAMDNSELLKPAVEEPVYASMHTMARPKIPSLLEALEQTANIHEISRPMIPDFATAIGQLPEVRPLPIELPSIIPLPVEMPSIGVQPLPEIEAPATKPLVQITVNVADPSLVEVVKPEMPSINTFPLMPISPSIPAPELTRPTQQVPEDLTRPMIESIMESLIRPAIQAPQHLTRPSIVDESPEIGTFPLMPVVPSGPASTFPLMEDLIRPVADMSVSDRMARPSPSNFANMHTMARPMIPQLSSVVEPSVNMHEMARPMIPNLQAILEALEELIEAETQEQTPEAPSKPVVQIIVNVVGNKESQSPVQTVPSIESPAIGNFPLMPIEKPSFGTFPVVEDIATFPLMPVETPEKPSFGTFPLVEDIATFPLMPVETPEKPSFGTFPMVEDIATFPLMPVETPEKPSFGTFPLDAAMIKPAEVPSDLTRPTVVDSDLMSLLRPVVQEPEVHFGTMDIRPATSLIR